MHWYKERLLSKPLWRNICGDFILKKIVNNDDIICSKVWNWVDKVIIKEQFCPFAERPRRADKIHLHVCHASTQADLLSSMYREYERLDKDDSIETSLIVLDALGEEFFDYLALLDACQRDLKSASYEGIYQLASFHPHYLFEGEASDSTSHYTNRSPFPIIHIIRESSIDAALESMSRPEAIPERNVKHAKILGKTFFTKHLE